jgi:lambda repressor-like predicted transcriptional regulator
MTPQEIKGHLVMKNIKSRDIARRLGVTDGAIHQVIYGYRKTEYVRRAIADAVGKTVAELWPPKTA